MTLTEEQVKNWKVVLTNMGMMKFVVDKLSHAEIEQIATNFKVRLEMESQADKIREMLRPPKRTKQEFKSKFHYKRF